MSDREKKEQDILNQELSEDEMDTVAGGTDKCADGKFGGCFMGLGRRHSCDSEIYIKYGRPLYRPDGSLNCAATVEDGSWCGSNDACYDAEAVYLGMTDCRKAWK